MRMRVHLLSRILVSPALAVLLSLAVLGCGTPSSSCAELGVTSGPATGAGVVQIEVYATPPAMCSGSQVTSTAAPLRQIDTTPVAPAALDLAPGVYVVHVVAYDQAKSSKVGEGCSFANVSANQTTCLPLAITPSGCTPIAHDNGAGGTYQSCEARGTYTANTATLACQSVQGTCMTQHCSGGGGDLAICSKTAADCVCWTYTGAGAGHVGNPGGGGCDCGTVSDPTWN